MIQGDIDEELLEYPAVTICPKISTKYGIAERLGNYIDPNKLPEKVLLLKKELLKCKIPSAMEVEKKMFHGSYTGFGKFQTLVHFSLGSQSVEALDEDLL